jgi:HNH endonuclease
MKHRYSLQAASDAIASSISYRQVLTKLGIIPAGGNYDTLKKFINLHNINTSHFKGQGWNKDRVEHPRVPLSDYLTNIKSITSHKLRKRLLRDGIFTHQCSSCKLSEWLGDPIPLELDHVNGYHDDNSLSNLRLLCPNCHSKTPTFRRSKGSLKI